MRTLKLFILGGLLFAAPLAAQVQQAQSVPPVGALDQVVSRVITREGQEMKVIGERSPIVETYIQKVRITENDGSWIPDGDHYFIGRAELSKGLDLTPLASASEKTMGHKLASLVRLFDFGTEFLPKGFLQMIYLDMGGLNTQNYRFDYVRREFLGEVRTLVFDVTPAQNAPKGRFVGRIWVEDKDYTIVRFNGSYSGRNKENSNETFHFDSWRVNAGPDLWLPAFIYSEQKTVAYPLAKSSTFKAQTRLWGYNAGSSQVEEELSQVLIESATPVIDKSQQNNDRTPLQQTRLWNQQAETNTLDKMERMGLVAPKGEIDKILETVVNNIEVTNNIDFDPSIQCRVLMTSTIESFTFGSTIVLSRGLIDVLPDEASLAAMLAKELGYILASRRQVDTRLAFYDRLQFDESTAFQHFDYARKPADDAKATAKATELLKNSPYKDQLETAQMFIAELQARSREIPNLISPRVGDAGLIRSQVAAPSDQSLATHIVALPLGGRIKLDPWDDKLELLKAKTVGTVADREKMPFEITPFMIYLMRVGSENPKTSTVNIPLRPGA